MSQLEEWETVELYDTLRYSDRNLMESARLVAYFASLPYMKDKVEISEFMKLPWDEGSVNELETEISNDEINMLKQKANKMKQMMKGKI